MATDPSIPQYSRNMYSKSAVLSPYPHYAALRSLGPVVWLTRHRVYAVSRYADCKRILLDHDTFVSGDGVALNPIANKVGRGTTLVSDGAEHAAKRAVLAHRMTPRALRSMSTTVEEFAEKVVDAALTKHFVDGVGDLATPLPLSVVPDLVGWPEDGRENLLRWAGATFDCLGPINKKSIGSVKATTEMLAFAHRVVRERSVLDGSMGHDVLTAADEGKLRPADCSSLMVDYMAPSLDTTIGAISSALYLFARHPDQWDAIREDHSLIPTAVNEVVRLESPLRAFTRRAVADADVGGSIVPRGGRVLVIYASANRDPAQWNDPDAFDVTRDAARQLGFGSGTHGCAGQGLARLETQSILRTLARRVERFELAGEPKWSSNNIIHRLEQLPLELVPDRGESS